MAKKAKLPNQREAVILRVLTGGEKYGLQLRNAFRERTGRDIPLGSLYPCMDAMIASGFVTARHGPTDNENGGGRRRYYRITAPGRRALDEAEIMALAILGGQTA